MCTGSKAQVNGEPGVVSSSNGSYKSACGMRRGRMKDRLQEQQLACAFRASGTLFERISWLSFRFWQVERFQCQLQGCFHSQRSNGQRFELKAGLQVQGLPFLFFQTGLGWFRCRELRFLVPNLQLQYQLIKDKSESIAYLGFKVKSYTSHIGFLRPHI